MKIKCNKRRAIKASSDYADLKGVDFRKARDILTKDGFSEHEYGDKDDNNGYAVYRKGDKEVELTYEWVGTKNNAHAGKVINVYVDENINGACGKKSVKASSIMSAADTSNLRIFVPSDCYVDVLVDSYEQGEGEQVNSWNFVIADSFKTAQELIDDIAESSFIFSNDINDYVFLDGSLQTDATVNADNDIPTQEELEAWKRGELELYVAHLWVRLDVGATTHMMTEDEAEAFGLSVY